ncbi:PSD1 and planctomycete cytochrome C domain-containing protein [Rubripirellula amarantea]|nr:PSD1 and planctomycete cytochrome C domain-containing protein [Rubripirellula amarantea]
MNNPRRFRHRFALTALLTVVLGSVTWGQEDSAEGNAFFESNIRPVLIKECYSCHSNQTGNARGGLRLDTQQLTIIGGDSGAAIVPGDLEESQLWLAITHQSSEMPPRGRLSDTVIEDFRRWIEMGAPDPRETEIVEVQSSITSADIETAKAEFWAYQPAHDHQPPRVNHDEWPTNAIDQFVLAKLESTALTPAVDADAQSVLRRLTFDLIGLPPTSEQRSSFENRWEESPESAIASMTSELLGSDQYGERWGRHWLDVARYAESTGRGVNMTYPHAWRYRDYVIDSFNDDKPFDQFTQEQIAGDLMPAKSDQQWSEQLIATTFLAVGAKAVNEQNPVQFAADLVDEQIDVTTRVFLGQSVACARCHDHKFDPIPQSDYYALAGIFAGMKTYFGNPPSEFGEAKTAQSRRTSSLLLLPVDDPNPYDASYSAQELKQLRDRIVEKRRELSQLGPRSGGNSIRERLRLTNEIAQLSAKYSVVDENGQPKSYCMGVQEPDQPRDVRVLVRGEIDAPGPVIPRGVPQVLNRDGVDIPVDQSGRLQLAQWIGSDANTLTARVMVNRVWKHLFGRGLVSSLEDFGSTGDRPSHPELLDHLTVGFIESGWSVKTLIQTIVTSRTYRMSSEFDQQHFEADPENRLLWRMEPRRLDAEAIRDAMLLISGDLQLERPRGSEVAKAGYVAVRDGTFGIDRDRIREQIEDAMKQQRVRTRRPFSGPRQAMGRPNPRQFLEEAIERERDRLDMTTATYRSVYLPVVRDEVPRSLEVFDFADPNTVIGNRESSNTANQALYFMNNPFVIQQSDATAQRIAKQSSRSIDQIKLAFEHIYGRQPSSTERVAAISLVKSMTGQKNNFNQRQLGVAALSTLCQSLFASAEFRYLD